jgi:protein SCO1
MNRKTILYTAFFVALVAVFLIVMGVIVPDFGKKKITAIGTIAPFAFTNQDGGTVTEKDVAGKVFVAEYFFTTCKGICLKMNNQMRRVYDEYNDEKDFLILSHTCDPATDSAAQLKRYADSLKVNTSKWIFLTGRKDSLYKMARHSYKIDDPANNLQDIDEDFLHTQFFALVDKQGNVRKIYDGIKSSEVNRMIDDIDKLLKE